MGDECSNGRHGRHVGPNVRRSKTRQAVDLQGLGVQDCFFAKNCCLIVYFAGGSVEHGRGHEREVLRSEGTPVEKAEAHNVGQDNTDPGVRLLQ